MKTKGIFERTMLLSLLFLFNPAFGQASTDPFSGNWEGKFIGDFRTLLEITSPSPGTYTGTIRMYNGPQMIQNDPVSEIRGSGTDITFLIPAKETSFKGRFSEDSNTLSGQLVFPDGSEHPIELTRIIDGADPGPAVTEAPSALYESLRTRQFTPDEMIRDFQILFESLQQYHPRLYGYTTEPQMNQLVDSIKRSLDRPLHLEEFLRRIVPAIDAVRCSHTGIRLPEDYRVLSRQYAKFLPFRVLCIPEGVYLIGTAVPSQPELPPGTRILSINEFPSDQILTELLQLVPAEGDNTTSKYDQISRHFAWYYHLLDPSEEFRVKFQAPASQPGALSSRAEASFTGCALNQAEPARAVYNEAIPLSFSISEGGKSALLQVPSFAVMNMDGYMAELDRIFGLLASQHIPHLILDLRGNEGGHPIFAAQLLSYLVHGEFTYFRRIPDISEFEPLYHPMSADPSAYQGSVYVLVDGRCLSTTGHLLSLIQYHTTAIFIGEEPGSTFHCNDFSIPVVLPNSRIEANIPRTTFEAAVPSGSGTGFRIDYPIVPDPGDVASGTDRAMLTCLTLIR
ncbi:MAG: S41 family peptidase [Bacteroidales bacterium]